ncbi:glutamate-cysteine ligase family protein [Haloferacaceae archaeon DSL9]
MEFWVVDETGSLATAAPLLSVSENVVPEFVDCLVEVKTDPCESTAELEAELTGHIARLLERAREENRRLVPLGTPLTDHDFDCDDSVRSEIQRRVIGDDFRLASYCAGTHMHFERANVVDQLNVLTAVDPAFALVNSSSFHRGRRIAACARPEIYRRQCYGDHPEHGQLWEYVDSLEEWWGRLETRFASFRADALDAGVDPTTFDELYSPEDAVWTPVRLRTEVPTVEWRSPDAALPSQIVQLADEVATLVEATATKPVTFGGAGRGLLEDRVELPSFEWLTRYVDEGIERGIDSLLLTAYLERMGFRPERYRPLATDIDATRLSEADARRVRLGAASMLERDLAVYAAG